jgi:hypothetical protein
LVVAFLCFFDRRVFEELNDHYYAKNRKTGTRLQPEGDEDFHSFSKQLAATAVGTVCDKPETVFEVFSDRGRWFGVWIHRVA